MSPEPPLPRRLPKFLRVMRARPRLSLAVVFALVIVAALPADWRAATRALVGWDIGVVLYLAGAFEIMAHADIARIRSRAALLDEGQTTILTLTVCAALASIAAIVMLLGTPEPGATRDPKSLALAAVTIVLSWFLIHTIFALHYAHEFYGGKHDSSPTPMLFPGEDKPDYWDFVYFSFVIGMTSQVSDIAIASKAIRRTVILHSVVSFFFNVALLALTVNIAASAL